MDEIIKSCTYRGDDPRFCPWPKPTPEAVQAYQSILKAIQEPRDLEGLQKAWFSVGKEAHDLIEPFPTLKNALVATKDYFKKMAIEGTLSDYRDKVIAGQKARAEAASRQGS